MRIPEIVHIGGLPYIVTRVPPSTLGEQREGFMRGKGLSAHMGGVIVELKLREDGVISEFASRFIPFYAATKDDYKNWI